MSRNKAVELTVRVKATTDKAVMIETERGTAWVPRSQIEDWSGSDDLDLNVESIFVPEWLAVEKGLV